MLIIECLMVFNIVDELLEVDFVKFCNMCFYMKKIFLEKVFYVLYIMENQVEVDVDIVEKV